MEGFSSISFENVMQNSANFIFWKDKKSIYLGCNLNFAKLIGLSKSEDIIGRTDYDLPWQHDGDGAKVFRQGDTKAINGYPLINVREKVSLPEVGKLTLLANKSPLINNKHRVIGIFGISVNVGAIEVYNQQKIDNVLLSKRQAECMYYLIRGKTARQISEILNLSCRTIESYIEIVKNKLGCHTKLELIEKAFQSGFVEFSIK